MSTREARDALLTTALATLPFQCVDVEGAHYRVSVQIKGGVKVPAFGPLDRGAPRLVSAAALAPLVRRTAVSASVACAALMPAGDVQMNWERRAEYVTQH